MNGGRNGIPADDAARTIADALEARRPARRYIVGGGLVSALVPHVPAAVLDAYVARWLKMDYGSHPDAGSRAKATDAGRTGSMP